MTLFLLIVLSIASVVNSILLGQAWDEIHMLNRQHALKCHEYDSFIQWHNKEEVAIKRKRRCKDCVNLSELEGCWFCEEAEQPCVYVQDCPEGVKE